MNKPTELPTDRQQENWKKKHEIEIDKEYRMKGANTLRNSTLLKILLWLLYIGAMSGNHTNERWVVKQHNTHTTEFVYLLVFPQSYEKLFSANVLEKE